MHYITHSTKVRNEIQIQKYEEKENWKGKRMGEHMEWWIYFCIEIDTFRQRCVQRGCVFVLVYERVSLHFIIQWLCEMWKFWGWQKTSDVLTIFWYARTHRHKYLPFSWYTKYAKYAVHKCSSNRCIDSIMFDWAQFKPQRFLQIEPIANTNQWFACRDAYFFSFFGYSFSRCWAKSNEIKHACFTQLPSSFTDEYHALKRSNY